MNIGMNFHSTTLTNPEGLRKLDLRWGLFLADPEEPWNDTLRLWPEVKVLCPRCEPVVRLYRPNVMGESPKLRAQQFCSMLNVEFGDQPVHSIPGNEFDQAIEHGGDDLQWWGGPDHLTLIASWLSRYVDAHRAMRPQDILHLPACSAGMEPGDYLAAMPWRKFDVIDLHLYNLEKWAKEMPLSFFGMPVAVTEWGKIGGTPEEYAAFARSLGDTMNCIWKWNDKDDNPEGDPAGYAIADRPDVIEALVIESHIVRPDDPLPESNAVIYEDELKEWPENEDTKEDKVGLSDAERQELLAMIDYAWGKAEQLYGGRMKKAEREKLAFEIQRQLVDMKLRWVIPEIQEGGSEPAPFLGG